MSTWLIENLSTWEVVLLLVGGLTAVALGGFWLVLRFAPSWREPPGPDVGNTFRGIGVSIFVISLAFSIVTLYQSYSNASGTVRTEAGVLAQLVRDADAFPPATRKALRKASYDYIKGVTGPEWQGMKRGVLVNATKPSFDQMYKVLFRFHPATPSESQFYGEWTKGVNDLIVARRARQAHATDSLPNSFEVLLLLGAFVAIFTTFLPRSPTLTLAWVTVVLNTAVIGVGLTTAVLLSHPFTGTVAVSQDPFFLGVLGRLVASGP